jgi:hypothetical protein
MAEIKIAGVILPNRELGAITLTTAVLEVVDENICLFVGDTVPKYRALEIVEAWRWLWNGVRDRNILKTFGGRTYSGAAIDNLDEFNRRTSSDLADFNDDDVFIGIGDQVAIQVGDASIVYLETAFTQLRQYALENVFKVT